MEPQAARSAQTPMLHAKNSNGEATMPTAGDFNRKAPSNVWHSPEFAKGVLNC